MLHTKLRTPANFGISIISCLMLLYVKKALASHNHATRGQSTAVLVNEYTTGQKIAPHAVGQDRTAHKTAVVGQVSYGKLRNKT